MKESFYLRHDYNSRNDERVLKLRAVMNIEGYGLFWMILEKLAESSEGRLKLEDIPSIAYELHSDSKRITDAIRSYGLFEYDDTYFWSNRLMRDLEERNEKSKKAILANKIRWDKQRKELQTDSIRSPNGIQDGIQGKERKGKERKGKETSTNVEGGEAPVYGNAEVNNMLEALKKLTNREDFRESKAQQRQYAWHLVGLVKKIGQEEFRRRLEGICKDDFKFKNLGSIRYLYQEVKAFSSVNPVRPNKITII